MGSVIPHPATSACTVKLGEGPEVAAWLEGKIDLLLPERRAGEDQDPARDY